MLVSSLEAAPMCVRQRLCDLCQCAHTVSEKVTGCSPEEPPRAAATAAFLMMAARRPSEGRHRLALVFCALGCLSGANL